MHQDGSPSDDALTVAHANLLADKSLQFDRSGYDPPETPSWVRWMAEVLQAFEPVLIWLFWIALAVIVVGLLFLIGREIIRLRSPPPKLETTTAGGPDSEWRPDARAARDLLGEADALAARGLYAEAVHLLLLRSVQDIETLRPRALGVSLTTREIATFKGLPAAARPAFAKIGRVVERSLFGGASVGLDDFAACREAYQAFALPQGWRA